MGYRDAGRDAAYQRERRKDPVKRQADLVKSRAWKARNREANKARDREYKRAKKAGDTRPESPFERLVRDQ